MSRTARFFLAVGVAASLAGCGWIEKLKEKERRSAARRQAVAETMAAAKAGDVARLREILAGDPTLANAVEKTPSSRRQMAREIGTTLTAAVSSGSVEAVKLLLDAGADPNGSGATERKTGLHLVSALEGKDAEALAIAGLLVDFGARADSLDDGGMSPVHALLNRGHDDAPRVPLLLVLLRRPEAREARDSDGRTPLHFAAKYGLESSLEALLLAGADPNARVTPMERLRDAERIDGTTPLHFAVGSGGSGVLELCASGADPAIRDDAGRTPVELARKLYGGERRDDERLRALEAAFASGGPCETLLARFRSDGRPDDFGAIRREALERHCASGAGAACERLAELWEKGDGVPEDPEKARAFYGKACDSGRAWSCGKAGWYLRWGKGGAPDPAAAARLFERGCDGGNGWSCNALGEMVRDGEGVPKDARRALSLFEKACQAREEKGCANGRALKAAGL
jgi:TPR repeat protein